MVGVMLLGLVPGCVTLVPPPVAQTALPAMLDDPRIDVRVVKKGEPAPHDGVWMNRFTLEALIQKAVNNAG